MTNLTQACRNILQQLRSVVDQIHPYDYSKPSEALSGSSVGQHLRHTLEFFFCFQQGFDTGTINYDKRAHDKFIESDKHSAIRAIDRVSEFVMNLQTDTNLVLEVGYDTKNEDFITLKTNASRELVYNIEHAVHHMAIMKIGIQEVASYIKLPADFGVAASTVRYHETVPQNR